MEDAVYWSELLKRRKISSVELIEETAKKIQEKNAALNALVTFDIEKARNEAKASTHLQSSIFGGQPIPLKILGQQKKGWAATAGAKLLAASKADRTDFFVEKIEEVGFIPFGQTNTPEFGFKNITDPKLYGPTRNPWNLAYSSGGSSGGAASAVAAGMFPIAGASDGGGSIRIPASFNGLIGLKPTRGVMPVGPSEWRSWQGASINFALTVSMRDTIQLFYAMRTAQAAAPYQAPKKEWLHEAPSDKAKLRIAYTTESPAKKSPSATTVAAVNEAVDFLRKQGHELTEIHYPINGFEMMDSYYKMNAGETAAMFTEIQESRKQVLKKEDMELMTWGLYQYGEKLSAASYINALQFWDTLAAKMEQLFSEYDLFLTPTTAFTAPEVDRKLQSEEIFQQLEIADSLNTSQLAEVVEMMFAESWQLTPYTQLANLTGQPAISLPTAISQQGLPLGIQFMAAKGREDFLFQAGQIFEAADRFRLPDYYLT